MKIKSFVLNVSFPQLRYLLREETLVEYIAFFFFSAVNIQLNAAFLFASDAGFFGINLYLVAAFEDLSDNFKEIENIEGTEYGNQINSITTSQSCKVNFHQIHFHTYLFIKPFHSNSELAQAKNQKEKFVSCVNFHRKILWLAKVVQDLYSPIIFFQFFFSCLQICAITLELLLVNLMDFCLILISI